MPRTEVAGYRIYYGVASRTYPNMVDVGNATSATIPGLVEDTTYYFAATAYASLGLESDDSDEISDTLPTAVAILQTRAASAGPFAPLVIGGGGSAPLRYSNGNFSLSFGTQNGVLYTVQYKTAMSDTAWTDLQTVSGTGGIVTIPHEVRGQPACFYRVVISPP